MFACLRWPFFFCRKAMAVVSPQQLQSATGLPGGALIPTSAATSASPQPRSLSMSRQTRLLLGYQSRPAQARTKQRRVEHNGAELGG